MEIPETVPNFPIIPIFVASLIFYKEKAIQFPVNVTARQTRIAPCLDSVDLSRAYSYSVIISERSVDFFVICQSRFCNFTLHRKGTNDDCINIGARARQL
jgi:hypothetical protein